MSQDLAAIKNLRRLLRTDSRGSVLQLLDDTLELLEHLELRIRAIEKTYEEKD